MTASRVDGSTVTLEVRDAIFEGDVLETADGAAIGVVFIDDSTFSLDEGARMVIDELVFDPASEEGAHRHFRWCRAHSVSLAARSQ